MQEKTVDLDTFLAELPAEMAAKAKAAAARIDELEHAADRIGQSDRRYLVLFAIAGLLALTATAIGLGGFDLFKRGHSTVLDFVVIGMAGAFPLLVLIYSLRMRERTKIDQKKFEIIEAYFLPYDAIYLPPGPDREHGLVTVSPRARAWRRANTDKGRRPGRYW